MSRHTLLTGRRARLILGLTMAIASGGQLTNAQSALPRIITRPDPAPDVSVRVDGPAFLDVNGYAQFTVTVNNAPPLIGWLASSSSHVGISIDLTGLDPVDLGTSNGLTCRPSGGDGLEWFRVYCDGNIRYASSAEVFVHVNRVPSARCNRPLYVDATATVTSGRDRSADNNRAIAATTLVCPA